MLNAKVSTSLSMASALTTIKKFVPANNWAGGEIRWPIFMGLWSFANFDNATVSSRVARNTLHGLYKLIGRCTGFTRMSKLDHKWRLNGVYVTNDQ